MKFLEESDACPKCKASWVDKPIPEESRKYYGGKTHFYRLIGVELPYDHPDHYDGVSMWECPDCHQQWDRWTGKEIDK